MLEAALGRARDAHELARAVAHETAQLVAFAFHAPRKMPAFQPAGRRERAAAQAPAGPRGTAADDARVRAFFIGLALSGGPDQQQE